ncbi:3-deoxy-D-manno-octulosonic acid kinase [Aestuariibacter halophilus]|uniref:3-deoxy-D-manno-octulosonic acid kinase n=1 Tax=Fluctibacter halophilus TaxID=226011 RepID=A0ABS8GA96_9ALTE|nr:3-deoxy-D-manno-octulosonic acid kinase [Aestuariibacter halophilus]MCC2617515.1 3-deoxy-D-manno-octulosonic acid kinase [Aestuariibacter halophilus]
MTLIQQKICQHQMLFAPASLLDQVSSDWFEPDHWRALGQLTGSAPGRGTTHFIQHQQHAWVLRHYCRGGMVGRWITDTFLYLGIARTRVWQELTLLQYMQDLGLPCPAPVAGRVSRHGLGYRCDLITVRIPGATDAHHRLCKASLSAQQWQDIGATIRRFHDHGIYHHDLNIHNIMLDDQQRVWLIDFDKCGRRRGNRWKAHNLSRLQRSLHKEHGKNGDYHFCMDDWQALLSGYGQGKNV